MRIGWLELLVWCLLPWLIGAVVVLVAVKAPEWLGEMFRGMR